MSLLWVILILTCLSQAITVLGTDALQAACFQLYLTLFYSNQQKERSRLRKEILSDKQALAATSSQDQFAKWAKLRRKVDKGIADLERLNDSISSVQLAFNLRFRLALWTLTSGIEIGLVAYYRRTAVAKLPRLWLSPLLRWIVAWPSVPVGKVSIVVWASICRQVSRSVIESVGGVSRMLVQVQSGRVGAEKKRV